MNNLKSQVYNALAEVIFSKYYTKGQAMPTKADMEKACTYFLTKFYEYSEYEDEQ